MALAALPALAQSPTSFVSSAPLTLSGKEALHRVALPPEAYRDARSDFADLRIFNSAGEAVPIGFAGDPDGQHDALPAVDLPQFAVSALARSTGGPGSEISVRTQDGTLVSIRGQAAAPIVKPSAYLLDASQVQEPLRALVFDWVAAPGAQVVKVRAEASDNLKDWSALRIRPAGASGERRSRAVAAAPGVRRTQGEVPAHHLGRGRVFAQGRARRTRGPDPARATYREQRGRHAWRASRRVALRRRRAPARRSAARAAGRCQRCGLGECAGAQRSQGAVAFRGVGAVLSHAVRGGRSGIARP